MDLILPIVAMGIRSGKILDNCPSKMDIDNLQTLTDTQNRFSQTDKTGKDIQLQPVQGGVYIAGTSVLFAKKGRVNIAAAREEQGITGIGLHGIEGYDWEGPQAGQGILVMGRLGRHSGNQDFIHGRMSFRKTAFEFIIFDGKRECNGYHRGRAA